MLLGNVLDLSRAAVRLQKHHRVFFHVRDLVGGARTLLERIVSRRIDEGLP